jgi:hypothetical protein
VEGVQALGRLGDDAHLVEIRQGGNLFFALDDNAPLAGESKEPVHLRVMRVPDDEDVIIPGGVFFDDCLDMADFGAGGVDHFQTRFLDLPPLLRRDAVSANDEGGPFPGLLDLLDRLNGSKPSFLKQFNRLGIVNERTERVEAGLALRDGHVKDHVHGPLDAHAEAGGLRQFNAHGFRASFLRSPRFPATPLRPSVAGPSQG